MLGCTSFTNGESPYVNKIYKYAVWIFVSSHKFSRLYPAAACNVSDYCFKFLKRMWIMQLQGKNEMLKELLIENARQDKQRKIYDFIMRCNAKLLLQSSMCMAAQNKIYALFYCWFVELKLKLNEPQYMHKCWRDWCRQWQ